MDYCVVCAVEYDGDRLRRKPFASNVTGAVEEFSSLPALRRLVEAGQARYLTKEQAEEFAERRAQAKPPDEYVHASPHRLADGWRVCWSPRPRERARGRKAIRYCWIVHPILASAAGLGLEQLPPVRLRQACTGLAGDALYDEVKRLEAVAVACVRAAVYALYRGGYLDDNDRGHDQCVAAANKAVRQVRKVLGYDTTPDLNF